MASLTHSSSTTGKTVSTLKSRLSNGEILYGIAIRSFSPVIVELAGFCGYDFAVLDMEHGPGGISDIIPCLQALAAAQTPAIIRIPESTATWAKRVLDLGPEGIMFPMIEDPQSAQMAVSFCRYPPNGIRGVAHRSCRESRYSLDQEYLRNYEDRLLILCQVESAAGVRKIDEISAVDGVDCITMGPLDLSASLGYLLDPGNEKVKEVMVDAEQTVIKGGNAYMTGFTMKHLPAEELRRRGYRMVAGASDMGLFKTAAVEDIKKFKASGVVNGV